MRYPCLSCLVSLLGIALNSASAQDGVIWSGSLARNNVAASLVAPTDWDVGQFDRKTGAWKRDTSRNVRWVAKSGGRTYGGPIIADGRVFVGTNNAAGYVKRFPADVDLGCVLAFRESDGQFLWQYSAPKLSSGRVHDWPLQGIGSTPLVQGNRLWFVDNRCRVVCLDTEGFHDGEDDGPERGVWEMLIETDSLLEGRLASHSSPIRQALQAAGVEFGPCSIWKDPKRDDQWQVRDQVNFPKTQEVFLLRREGQQLVGYPPVKPGTVELGAALFCIDNRLYPGLENGQFGPEIRRFFHDRMIVVPDPSAITTEIPGKCWSFSATDERIERTFRILLEGSRLTISFKAASGHAHEADLVWRRDLMADLGVSPHSMANCSPVAWGNTLFISTSNGVDESHLTIPAPQAPSFIAVDKNSGRVLWSDNSPGENILHGQWSSPAVGELGGVPQVIFAGGDGWLYSFRADTWNQETRRPILLWKFDGNPKESLGILGGRGTRNPIVAAPVIYEGRVYVAVGDDPEHGEGPGHLWCIDPTRRGDVSPQLAMKHFEGTSIPIPHRRLQAVNREDGEFAIDNSNSAVVWHYEKSDLDGDGKFDFDETMHRSTSNVAIKNGLLIIPDIAGVVHCLDARTGQCHWTFNLLASCWASPLIVGDKVYLGDEDGDMAILHLSADSMKLPQGPRKRNRLGEIMVAEPLATIQTGSCIYATPSVVNEVLYFANNQGLFAIANDP